MIWFIFDVAEAVLAGYLFYLIWNVYFDLVVKEGGSHESDD